ncbi:MAG TPA: serine/threonine-protein kinase, partial [Polyangiaceae bacterium]|nr:serine/threonine-protein kinase [Polyangiaceae bacterium]
GSMGRVYTARDAREQRVVAAKILHRQLADNPAVVSRFEREARLARRLDHPNIVAIEATGGVSDPAGAFKGLPVLVMEWISGVSLRSELVRHPSGFAPERALHVVREICAAVREAHRVGIVHRDLKPANVMLVAGESGSRERVKVLDFGIAKSTLEQGSHPTTKGSVLGTPLYISPEAALGDSVTPASDVYSLAVLLFECIAGRPPFDAPNPIAVLIQHTSSEPPRLDELPAGPRVPRSLAELVHSNLAKKPGDRLKDAGEFLEALAQISLPSAQQSGH